jgi:hypothetical protein
MGFLNASILKKFLAHCIYLKSKQIYTQMSCTANAYQINSKYSCIQYNGRIA